MMIVGGHADVLYQAALETLLAAGNRVSPRGMPTLEIEGAQLYLEHADNNIVTIPQRKLNYAFSVAEWLWILLGREDVASISHFNKNIGAFSDNGVVFAGAYGPRIKPQLPWVVEALRSDKDTRQAVMTIWSPRPGPSKDIPCTVSMQFLIRRGALDAHVYMRSNDAWLGLPYDLFNFTRIQAYVAARVGLPVGTYRHTVGSFHLYERDRANALLVARSNLMRPSRSPRLLTAAPDDFEAVFERAARGEPLDDEAVGRLPRPWDVYARVLDYRNRKDASLLPEPYRSIMDLRRPL